MIEKILSLVKMILSYLLKGRKEETVPREQRDISLLKPKLQVIVRAIQKKIIEHNLPIEVFETGRTIERQRQLFRKGTSKTMNSRHLTGEAVDFVVRINGRWSWKSKHIYIYEMFGALMTGLYGKQVEWGFDMWKWDYPHFQLKRKK